MATKIWLGNDSGNEGNWGTAANWSPSGVPVNNDDVYFIGGLLSGDDQSVTSGLDQSAVQLQSITIMQSFTGHIGTYNEYLQFDSTVNPVIEIGRDDGSGRAAGSQRIKLAPNGSDAHTLRVFNSANSSADTGLQPIRIKGGAAGSAVVITGGRVGFGTTDPTETYTAATFEITPSDSGIKPDVTIGAGATVATSVAVGAGARLVALTAIPTLTNKGGEILKHDGGTIGTLTSYGGRVEILQGAVTTLNFYGGALILSAPDTVSTLNIYGGNVDTLKSDKSRTIGQVNVFPGVMFSYNENVAISNDIDFFGKQQIAVSNI